MKSFFGVFAGTAFVLLLATSALAFDVLRENNLVLPRTFLGDIALGGMTEPQVEALVKIRFKEFLDTPVQLATRGEVAEVTMRELGVVLDEKEILKQIPFGQRMNSAAMVLQTFAGQRITPEAEAPHSELLRVINEKFPSIPKTKNAHFAREGKILKIVEGKGGVIPKLDLLAADMETNIAFLQRQPLVVELSKEEPTVRAADLEKYRADIEKKLPETVTLYLEKESFSVDFKKHPEWITFEKLPASAPEEFPFSMKFDPVAFSNFLKETVAARLEQPAEDMRILQDAEGKITFEGRGNDGRAIEKEKLLTSLDEAIMKGESKVGIPLSVVSPKIEIAPALQELGIKELIAVGYTRYEGSPANRKHNIGVGVAKYNGLIIPPGETFSFNKNLGPVDASTGYRRELVIKPEGTIPEFGGGLCQVSTTLYRAAINAGLPIVERAAHSYAVTYYSQVGGHGLDATIYPPARDLKFANDTPDSLLIQSYVEGDSAYFKFYGTSDGRTVKLEGPYISNRQGVPATAIEVPDANLQPGQRKQVEKPHAGFDALWYRYITKDGKTVKEEIFSRYRAVPAKYLVGGVPEQEVSVQDMPNPFE